MGQEASFLLRSRKSRVVENKLKAFFLPHPRPGSNYFIAPGRRNLSGQFGGAVVAIRSTHSLGGRQSRLLIFHARIPVPSADGGIRAICALVTREAIDERQVQDVPAASTAATTKATATVVSSTSASNSPGGTSEKGSHQRLRTEGI